MPHADESYPWTREGVTEAVEEAMNCWPRLREVFVVAEASSVADAWDVRLDPQGTCRTAQIRLDMVREGALQRVAQALRAAAPQSKS